MTRLRRSFLALAAVVCVTAVVAAVASRAPRVAGRTALASEKDERPATGLTFRLSDAEPIESSAGTVSVGPSVPLDEAATAALLDRLPPLAAGPSDEQSFSLRDSSLPPPRTGKTIVEAFPPPSHVETPPVSSAPLTVLRHAPDGDVPLAANLSVTFSQPMVAVTSHADLTQAAVPVKLTPQPAGSWRWVGTQTLIFETTARLPMATDYSVEVPAGTTDANGRALAAAERWRFSTPPPTLVSSYPSTVTRFDPILFAAFDQQIDPAAVLGTIRVQAANTVARLRLVTADEVQADEAVWRRVKDAPAGRWIAFRAVDSLPRGTDVTVTVGPGTPSAEGSKITVKPQAWHFRTFGPMRGTGQSCGWGPRCLPLLPWRIHFSNPIDADTFSESMVRVEPPIAGVTVSAQGSDVVIQGPSRGRTSYRVTVSEVRDTFGQPLETPYAATVEVEPGQPLLMSGARGWTQMVVLDPAANLRFPVYSLNHPALLVRAYAVTPSDWPAFEAHARDRFSTIPPALPGTLVLSRTIQVKAQPEEIVETDLDLRPALPHGVGQIVLHVTAAGRPASRPEPAWADGRSDEVLVWVQSTHIGLDAFADGENVLAWVSALETGKPLANARVSLLPSNRSGVTGADGTARIAFDPNAAALVARLGDDVAMLPGNDYAWRRSEADSADALVWHVFDDRALYRPGEDVKVKGWVRIRGGGSQGDLQPVGGAVSSLAYQAVSEDGAEIAKGTVRLNAFGAFDLGFKLPANVQLGSARVEFKPNASRFEKPGFTHDFRIEEFRRPEFEVTSTASDGPHFVGGHATVSVTASYFAGGGLPTADVAWTVSAGPGSFTPPNRNDFTFGHWFPWWASADAEGGNREETHSARTDASGTHSLRIDFDSVNPPGPTSLTATATVTDVNRQAWSTTTHLLVHSSSLYVGLKTPRYFVERGQPLPVDLIVTDLDGHAVAGRPVHVTAEHLEWKQRRGTWREEATGREECSVTSATEPSQCTFKTAGGGTYRITASVTDADNRPNETRILRWASGGAVRTSKTVEQEKVTLVPDKDEYRAGDVAEILVVPPFSPTEALMTIRRSGIVRSERFTIDGPSRTIRIPIEERRTPNVFVQVDLVGAAARVTNAGQPDSRLPKRPAFASGNLKLAIPPAQRTLAVVVKPSDKMVQPGGETTVGITVKDAAGRPAAKGEVAVVVVDEAVLSMTDYSTPDPISDFYAAREEGVGDGRLRQNVLLAQIPEPDGGGGGAPPPPPPSAAARAMMAPMEARSFFGLASGAGGIAGGVAGAIRTRTDFNPLALFAASVITDASGSAEVRVKVPDNLTRYRVMAIAATAGVEFGSGESTITARLPLMVRASAPRFLNLGDRAEIPVVLQNQTDSALSVDVAVRAANAVVVGPAGRRVSVPPNDRIEVRFPATTRSPGIARFQAAAASARFSDASEVSLPVRTPATTEAFAAYGQIDDGATAQRVKAPADAFPEFGGLDITTSSTALQSLTDAVLYLVSYPFECGEQLSSRVLAIAALRDVLAAFAAPGLPDAKTLQAAADRDVKRLSGLQNDDGGFALWRRGDESWPYVSVHVVHALVRAKAKGFTVPDGTLNEGLRYLKDIEKRIPARYGPDSRRVLIAYSLYVRNLAGDHDAARGRKLVAEAGLPKLSFEAIGWLLSVFAADRGSATEVAAIRTFLNNHATDTAATAHFAASYEDGAQFLFQSDRRADAVLLDALIAADPKSDLIPKIVEGLLAHRSAGRWENTQENVFILLALDRYFRTYEKVTPNFVARAWLGDRYAGDHAFRGRTTDRHLVRVPLQALASLKAPADLVLSKEGPGRLYYRVGLQYAPRNLDLKPMDRGFTVERTYAAVDNPADVRRDADGTWHVRPGARVRVRLSMIAPDRRYHVALVDPLPAGFEALNPALAVTAAPPPDPSENADPRTRRWFWSYRWFEHENLRDDRAEAFTSLLWDGVYTYTYVARATTPGQFIVPPPRAEEMYHPETFGRGATDRVVVEIK